MAEPTRAPARREYRKRVRADGEARTRQAIIDAAVACFSEAPFERVTVSALAQRAGLGVQTLLRIHGTKAEIFLAAVRSVVAPLMDRRDVVAPGDVDAAIDLLAGDYERWGDVHERLFVRPRLLPELDALSDEMRGRHRRWVRAVFADELEPLSGTALRQVLGALVVVLDIGTYRRLRSEGLPPAAARQAIRLLVTSVLADASTSGRAAR